MIKIFKLFNENDKYFVVFNFNDKLIKIVSKDDLGDSFSETNIEGILIEHNVENAWSSSDSYNEEDDGALVFIIFVKDKGILHRLQYKVYDDGTVDRNSLPLGTNDTFIKNEFGEGLL